ncbi:MAG: serine hydrolase, partial [Thermodesulfobacteriota bacterium]
RSPGRDCLYSDIGFMILEWLVKEAAGERLDRFLDKEICTPLQIRDLFFIDLFSEKPAAENQKRENRIVATEKCSWRRKMLCGEVHDDNAWAAGGIGGHAGLFGDAGSVLKLAREILKALQGRETHVLNTMVIREFVKKKGPFSHVAGFDTPSGQNPSAGRYFSSSSIGHLGFTGTSFWIDPENSVIVILLTNRVHPSRENNAIRLFRPRLHDLVMERLLKNREECK